MWSLLVREVFLLRWDFDTSSKVAKPFRLKVVMVDLDDALAALAAEGAAQDADADMADALAILRALASL